MRPYNAKELKEMLNRMSETVSGNRRKFADRYKGEVAACMDRMIGENKRRDLVKWMTDGRTDRMRELSEGEVLALHDWLKPSYDRLLKEYVSTDEYAEREMGSAWVEAQREMGQIEFKLGLDEEGFY